MENNNDNNINDNIRAPDPVFCEKLIDDEEDAFYLNPPVYNALPKLKRQITNTWTTQKTDDNRFISVPLFKDIDEDDEQEDDNKTWLYDSIQNNSENMDDYDLEKAIQESFKQYNLENKNTLLPLIDSDDEETKTIPQFEKKNLLPIFKSKIQRLIYFDKGLKEIYELIKPIIELYENGELNYHETDNVSYDKIFNTLRSLRIPKEEWSILETIFVKQLN
jgi:hypothetical protein